MKILVALDGSALAQGALHHALQMARDGQRIQLLVVHVQAQRASLYALAKGRGAEPDVQADRQVQAMMEEAQALARASRVPCDCLVDRGDAAPALVRAALDHGCDAIVMGARGQGGHRSTALGSVAHALLYRCVLPVTLVRTPPLTAADDPTELTIDRTIPLIKR